MARIKAPTQLEGQIPAKCDVLVIGGGIFGAASTYYLAKRGLDVVLLEKREVACAQSGRNWGFIRQQARDEIELPLAMESRRLWENMCTELGVDVEWTQGGSLLIPANDEAAQLYVDWARMAAEHGLKTQMLTMDQMAILLPGITQRWTVGVYTPSDGHANPIKSTRALVDAAIRVGAQIFTGVRVVALVASGGRIQGVQTDRGAVRCSAVVCAAGAGSKDLLATVGVDLPQGFVCTTVGLTKPVPPLARTTVWAPGRLAFRQAADGSIVFSRGGEKVDAEVVPGTLQHLRMFLPLFLQNRRRFRLHIDVGSFLAAMRAGTPGADHLEEPSANSTDVTVGLQRLQEWFPQLRGQLELDRAWAGRIEGTPDAVPVIEAVERPRGLVIATGLSGHGFALGPVCGVVVSELICDGQCRFDLRPMRIGRFADRTYGRPNAIL